MINNGQIKEITSWIKTIFFTIIIALLIKTFLFSSTRVEGSSMEPTFSTKDRVITSKISYRIGDIEKGDVIIFQAPDDKEKNYIKRVIGVSGDIVEIRNRKVYVNGKAIKEDYLYENAYTDTEINNKWIVDTGKLFVLGDNRMASTDSRKLGVISEDKVKGKAIFRYFPFNKIEIFN